MEFNKDKLVDYINDNKVLSCIVSHETIDVPNDSGWNQFEYTGNVTITFNIQGGK